jgi:membrane-bound ClpP family serine protease
MATQRVHGFRRRSAGRATQERTRAMEPGWPRHEDEPQAGPPAGEPPADAGWRAEVTAASGLNVLAGIWLILSPWILGYTGADAAWNPIVFGAIVLVLALVRVAGAYRAAGLSVINALIGVWLFVSGFWLADSGAARWNVWILGVVVFCLGVVSAQARDRRAAAGV